MSKHTPGLWKASGLDVFSQDGIYIADCDASISLLTENEIKKANARLIAAAPELLDVLEAIIDRWDTPLWKDVPHTAEYINRARSVVAKAKVE